MARYLLPVLAFTAAVLAKTDLEGCTSFTSTVTVNPSPGYGNTYETVIWYVPDTLEICAGVDCGGGRAPPRKVPGCPAYSGTETVTASFLPTNPAALRPTATPTATPTAFTTVLGETDADKATATTSATVSKRTSTIIKIVTTTLSTGQASGTKHAIGSVDPTDGASRGNGTASATTRATVTSTITTTPAAGGSGSGSGAAGASSTEVPAGAGPTARAGVAVIIGVAAAIAAFA